MAKRRWKKLPEKQRNQIIGFAAEGKGVTKIAALTLVSLPSIYRVLKPFGGVNLVHREWEPAKGQLTIDDRIEIQLGLSKGWSYERIADGLGFVRSSIWREVRRNGGLKKYQAMNAHRAARLRAMRSAPTKLASNPELLAVVEEKLGLWWSPKLISLWLRLEYYARPEMWVSHETIYKSLYVQGRGELRRELTACLRTGRAKRKARGTEQRGGKIKDMINIANRPAEVEDRAVPGHWEGDLIIGKDGLSAVGTLVERTTRYVMFLHLPDGRTAEKVREAMTAAMLGLPEVLQKSVTWDQGKELAEHAQFTIDTDIDVYFCDPHSPWQRGTNENTNGLARQYMPKSTDLSVHSAEDLAGFAYSLNTRPRETLGLMTPLAKLEELVALHT